MLKELSDSLILVRVQTWDLGAPTPRALEDAFALKWPSTVGIVAAGPTDHDSRVAAILCVGPTEWLVIGADPNAAVILRPLQAALDGTPFRATTVTDSLAQIVIEGPQARLMLAKASSLDLHPSRFSPARCARTRLAGMPVLLWCTKEFNFRCIVASSYREYLLAWLADAGLEMETSTLACNTS